MNSFKRRHPNEVYQRDGLPDGWFGIRHDHVPDKEGRRKSHGRWFRIKSEFGTIYRVPRFARNLERGSILLDWPGWLDLNGRKADLKESLDLEITPVEWWQVFYLFPLIAKSQPDPAGRLANYIAISLGVLSILLGSIGVRLAL